MPLYALGLNHATAPVKVRERIAFQMESLGPALRDLIGCPTVKEAAILSTCNRTEVYFQGADAEPVVRWLEDFHGVTTATLSPHLYTLAQDKAVPHAFRVASGLDSMVLGEPQILGQMKQAVKTAEAAGSLGLVLNRLFQRTFAVAKDVRTNTDIGSASISMAAAAVRLAERIFPSISEQRVLLIGAGDMIDLAATHFAARTPKSITVANRTLERGAQLAARFSADAIALTELPERLAQFDIIVTSTASSGFGALLNNRIAHFFSLLVPGAENLEPDKLFQSPASIRALSPAVREGAIETMSRSIHVVFVAAVPIAILAFLVVLKLREIPLRSTVHGAGDGGPTRDEPSASAVGIADPLLHGT